eukprot:291286-Pelagomonas_calceolata.AAC.1
MLCLVGFGSAGTYNDIQVTETSLIRVCAHFMLCLMGFDSAGTWERAGGGESSGRGGRSSGGGGGGGSGGGRASRRGGRAEQAASVAGVPHVVEPSGIGDSQMLQAY